MLPILNLTILYLMLFFRCASSFFFTCLIYFGRTANTLLYKLIALSRVVKKLCLYHIVDYAVELFGHVEKHDVFVCNTIKYFVLHIIYRLLRNCLMI